MGDVVKVNIPDIGGASNVDVIEILVAEGDTLAVDDAVLTLETDKASMDIPTNVAGVVKTIHLKVGDKVSEGDLMISIEAEAQSAATKPEPAPKPAAEAKPAPAAAPAASPSTAAGKMGEGDMQADVVVLGAGPGGYTAAFRAADLGLKVILIEKNDRLGGVCLNVGCIPSKALLHAAQVIEESEKAAEHGISFGKPAVDLDKLRGWKDSIIARLTGGLNGLAKQRKVTVVYGTGQFIGSHQLEVVDSQGKKTVVGFRNAIIAAGSEPVKLPFFPDDDRIMDSTGALELRDVPKKLLVVGGGIIGLEMATVYHALGSQITVVEMLDGIAAGADRDMVKPLQERLLAQYESIMLKTRVTQVKAQKNGLKVTFEGEQAPDKDQIYDRILLAVGRSSNGGKVAADRAGVSVDERGFIKVDSQQRTNVPHIFAIGDLVGQPMLAHKAVHEGKVAAEVCAGENSHFDAMVIPSVAYTHPELAWVGLTEAQAKEKGIAYEKAVFPWAASGRALSMGAENGLTKLLTDAATGKVIGGAVVGASAGDLIAEVALAIETHCDAADIGLTVHAHPTLSETVAMAAEALEGTLTDLYMPKKSK